MLIYLWRRWDFVGATVVQVTTCCWREERKITVRTRIWILQKERVLEKKHFKYSILICMDISDSFDSPNCV